MIITIANEEFYKKLKSFVLWEAFKHTKGEKVTFAAFDLTDDQSYIFGRVCVELTLRHLGSKTNCNDGIRVIVDKIINQEDQLINGIRKNTNKL